MLGAGRVERIFTQKGKFPIDIIGNYGMQYAKYNKSTKNIEVVRNKPYNKYYALDIYCKENEISHDEVVFVGDDYGIGGNDESVYLSDFKFIKVDDYKKSPEILEFL